MSADLLDSPEVFDAHRSAAEGSNNGGNAVNFVHGAVVGPFLHLVQAEPLAAARLAEGDLAAGHHEMTIAAHQKIAAIRLDYYRSNA